MKAFTKKIVLENGREFYGFGFGSDREAINEIVFNTSMVGYQEIMSDPSYTDQMVVMTYPLIGNYGMTDDDYETKTPTIGGMIVREYNDLPSNFRYTKTLNEVFEEYDIPAISGVDTRALTRIIRDEGCQRVIITDAATPHEEAMARLRAYEMPHDMVSRVSCKKRWMSRVANHKYDVVAIDCGIKYNIVRLLNRVGCNVIVMPYNSTVEEVLASDLRNLHGSPADLAGLRGEDLQDEVRAPGCEPSGEEPGDGEAGDHEPEPQLCGGYRLAEGHGTDAYARQPAGRHGRRRGVRRGGRLLDAVPSGERFGPSGQRLSVQ